MANVVHDAAGNEVVAAYLAEQLWLVRLVLRSSGKETPAYLESYRHVCKARFAALQNYGKTKPILQKTTAHIRQNMSGMEAVIKMS